MKTAGKDFHLPLVPVSPSKFTSLKGNSLLLLAAIHKAENSGDNEVHLTVSGLLFACADADIELQFYVHLLLQHIRQLLKNIIQTASWFSALGKSKSEIL